MTELMKQYEAETGEIATWHWHDKELVTDDYIAWLESQLTWRQVSEKPEKEGWYLCKIQYIDDFIGEETVFFNGERFVSSDVIKWLPIPEEGV